MATNTVPQSTHNSGVKLTDSLILSFKPALVFKHFVSTFINLIFLSYSQKRSTQLIFPTMDAT